MQIPPEHQHWADDSIIVKSKARKMARSNRMNEHDTDEFVQEACMEVYRRSSQHVPSRAPRPAFIAKVTKNVLLNLIDKRYAKKRDCRRDKEFDDVGEHVLIDGETTPDKVDLKMDVREALAGLPEEVRKIAFLRQSMTEAQIAKEPGMTRAKVRWALSRIESTLVNAGLRPKSSK